MTQTSILLTEENPIAAALALLKVDGWAIGEFRCVEDSQGNGKAGSRCAVGAVRAVLKVDEDDNTLQVTGWTEEKDDFDGKTYMVPVTKPITAKVAKKYRKAIIALADAVDPTWPENFQRDWDDERATDKLVRKNAFLGEIEEVITEYNDHLTLDEKGRKKVMRKFEKAAKAWNAQKAE